MKSDASRRNFLTAGLALPVAGMAAPQNAAKGPAPQVKDSGLRFKTLGRSGLKVTTVGFGTMITSDASVITRAADLGINYFDTAVGYQSGNCESMVGVALKGKRDKLVISTKSPAESKQQALADLDTSLKRLQTDYVDIWFLHAKGRADQLTDERLEANEIAKKAGKIRFSGVSTHGGQESVIPAMIASGKWDVPLTSYNFAMGTKLDPLVEQARKAGMGVVAMKVMAGGFRRMKPGEKIYTTLKKDGAMLAALRWALKNPNVDTTIPSITDMDQLEENMTAMVAPFSRDDEQLLARQLEFIRPLYCRACGQCNGMCPQGLPVQDMLRFLMYAEGYGQYGLGREQFQMLDASVREVKCTLCPECTIQCPNGVAVAQRVARAQEMFA